MADHGNDKEQCHDQGDILPALSADTSVYDHQSIREDINGYIHAAVPGFFEKFFVGKPWSTASQVVASSKDLDIFKTRFSELESSTALSRLLQEVLQLGRKDGRYYALQTPPGRLPSRQWDPIALFNTKRNSEFRPEVVGVFSPTEASNYKNGLLDLCGNARAIDRKSVV